MRVLFFAYHYPPDMAVGAIRARRVAEALASAGHEVQVITARLPGETSPIRSSTNSLIVHTVACLPHLGRVRIRSYRKTRAAGSETKQAPGPSSNGRSKWGEAWRRWVRSVLFFPDDCQGFIWPAARVGWRLGAAGADLLYSSSPPVSAHFAAWLTHWRTGIPWVIEFRDPRDKVPELQSAAVELLERRIERRMLRAARQIVCVTDGIRNHFAEKLGPGQEEKLLVVRNGIGELAPPLHQAGRPRPFRVLHAGTFYIQRDPRPFLDALQKVRCRRSLSAEDIRVDLIGDCREFNGLSMEEEVKRRGLEDLVTIQDWIPHGETRALMESADLLLLLAQKQPLQVPNKLYDYLGARIPILAYTDANGESAAMLRRLGGHYLVTTEDPEEGAQALDRAYAEAGAAAPALEAESLLQEWASETQMARLVRAVSALRE